MAETKSYTFTIVIEKEPEDPGYFAHVLELPGCCSAGETADEARLQIRDAIELHVASMIDDGIPIPQERIEVVVESVTVAVPA